MVMPSIYTHTRIINDKFRAKVETYSQCQTSGRWRRVKITTDEWLRRSLWCRFMRRRGGKSGLHRAGCRVTPGRRELKESATENKQPARVMVKR